MLINTTLLLLAPVKTKFEFPSHPCLVPRNEGRRQYRLLVRNRGNVDENDPSHPCLVPRNEGKPVKVGGQAAQAGNRQATEKLALHIIWLLYYSCSTVCGASFASRMHRRRVACRGECMHRCCMQRRPQLMFAVTSAWGRHPDTQPAALAAS